MNGLNGLNGLNVDGPPSRQPPQLSMLSRSMSASQTRTVRFRITCDEDFITLGLVGNTSWLGAWDLASTIPLTKENEEVATGDGSSDDAGVMGRPRHVWVSGPLEAPYLDRTPFRYRVVANGGRSSPNKRPLVWDVHSRHVYSVGDDGVVEGAFLLHCDARGPEGGGEGGAGGVGPPRDARLNAVVDSGWVHRGGAGAYQLRVDVPSLPAVETAAPLNSLVTLVDSYAARCPADDLEVVLYQARVKGGSVPRQFACEKYECSPLTAVGVGGDDDGEAAVHPSASLGVNSMLEYVTYVMNAQTLEELEFGIDVVRRSTGETVAKGFVPADCMDELEGKLSVSLVGVEDFGLAGHFKATYLVVTALVRVVLFRFVLYVAGWSRVDDRQGPRATVSHGRPHRTEQR